MSLHEKMNMMKRAIVLEAIQQADMNLSLAARRLKVHRNTIDRICTDLRIDVGQLRENRKAAVALAEGRERLLA